LIIDVGKKRRINVLEHIPTTFKIIRSPNNKKYFVTRIETKHYKATIITIRSKHGK